MFIDIYIVAKDKEVHVTLNTVNMILVSLVIKEGNYLSSMFSLSWVCTYEYYIILYIFCKQKIFCHFISRKEKEKYTRISTVVNSKGRIVGEILLLFKNFPLLFIMTFMTEKKC